MNIVLLFSLIEWVFCYYGYFVFELTCSLSLVSFTFYVKLHRNNCFHCHCQPIWTFFYKKRIYIPSNAVNVITLQYFGQNFILVHCYTAVSKIHPFYFAISSSIFNQISLLSFCRKSHVWRLLLFFNYRIVMKQC